jgi:hypothetical protein
MIEVYRLKKLSKSSINIFEYEMMPKAVFLAIGITLVSITLGTIALLVQIQSCNNHLSGNIVNYRINLLHKLGPEMVEWLEGYHPPKRYTIENLKTIQKWFKRKTRRLENEGNN